MSNIEDTGDDEVGRQAVADVLSEFLEKSFANIEFIPPPKLQDQTENIRLHMLDIINANGGVWCENGAEFLAASLIDVIATVNEADRSVTFSIIQKPGAYLTFNLKITKPEPCDYCGDGKLTGLPGNACENCMGTGLRYPSTADTRAS